MDISYGCRLVFMQRVKTLIEECVMTVYVPDVFHPPGSHGYVASSDVMSSCIVIRSYYRTLVDLA